MNRLFALIATTAFAQEFHDEWDPEPDSLDGVVVKNLDENELKKLTGGEQSNIRVYAEINRLFEQKKKAVKSP